MAAAANLDWLYHLLGWTLAAAGLLLLLWALFWDRSRGRKRCPKCWYSMEGVPGLSCPECGREARTESDLQRTHRKWRWVIAAGLGLFTSVMLGPVRDVWQHGWRGVPTIVLIKLPNWTHRDSVLNEIDRRLGSQRRIFSSSGPVSDSPPHWDQGKLSDQQWKDLAHRCIGLFGTSDRNAAAWAVTNVAWGLPSPQSSVADIHVKLTGQDLAERVDAALCVMLIASRYNAWMNVTPGGRDCNVRFQPLVPGLVALLQLSADDPLLLPYPTISSLGRSWMSGTPPDLPRPTSARSVVRGVAADALAGFKTRDPAALKALQVAASDADAWVAYFAQQALNRPDLERY